MNRTDFRYAQKIVFGDRRISQSVVQTNMSITHQLINELRCSQTSVVPYEDSWVRGITCASDNRFSLNRLTFALCGEQIGEGKHGFTRFFRSALSDPFAANWLRSALETLLLQNIPTTFYRVATPEPAVLFCFDRKSHAAYFAACSDEGYFNNQKVDPTRRVVEREKSYAHFMQRLTQR